MIGPPARCLIRLTSEGGHKIVTIKRKGDHPDDKLELDDSRSQTRMTTFDATLAIAKLP